jgi:hypothetical protein
VNSPQKLESRNFSPNRETDLHKFLTLTSIDIQKRKNEVKPPTNEGGQTHSRKTTTIFTR